VTLEDLYPPTFGSRPYYLVFATSAAGSSATAVVVPAATAVPPTAALEQVAVASARPIAPTAGAAVTRVSPTAVLPPAPPDAQLSIPALGDRRSVLLLAAAALLIAGVVVLARSRARAVGWAPVAGVLYLFDQETREARTAMVRDDPQPLVVWRRPLRVAALDRQDDRGVGEIRRAADGLVLYEVAADTAAPLVHDTLYTLAGGAVTLRYRSMNGARGARIGR
jgi:hypothetical protein